ncbi:hypothetical protein E1B28_007782 [Marasmius oreades]|uniref:DNA polymerase delta subunit 4 n=1 Tax=Marasmius oreades TaxID=181124 RepID=A0A9P7UTU0_9AGAR|nr:uncharacterized protein E1B28_007782 [Marasmius oreades]KAG7094172.1 hypothetical protein E1B28_007782 [Marasmius oreades]
MPVTRSKSSSATKQGTLNFSSLKRTNSTSNVSKSNRKKAAPIDVEASPSDAESREEARKPQVHTGKKVELYVGLPPTRPELKVNDPRWKPLLADAREKNNHLPLVHAENQNNIHHILRVFDMNYEYGPCVGLTRLERWERAEALGLKPPVQIRDILLTRQGIEDTDLAQNCLYGQL